MSGDVLDDMMRQLRRDPWRIALTLLGIVIGSGAIVFLASTLYAANTALAHSSQDASGADVTRVEERRPPPGTSRSAPELSEQDVRAMTDHEKSNAVGSSSLYGREASARGRTKRVGVQSGGTGYGELAKLKLVHGRWPLPEEDGVRVCVIGNDVWTDLYGGKWPLEDSGLVLDGGTRFTVVGVLEPKPPIGGGDGDGTWRIDRRLFVSHATFKRAIATANSYDEISLRHAGTDGKTRDAKQVAQGLTPVLLNLHRGVKNFEFDALSHGADLDVILDLALFVILVGCGIVATVTGGINVMNAQLVVVSERTREFGIRRAVGVSARRLSGTVLVETVLLTAIGGVAGAGLGLVGAKVMSALLTQWVTPWPFEIVTWSLVVALTNSVVAGVLAGVLPARRAANLDVVTCLRGE